MDDQTAQQLEWICPECGAEFCAVGTFTKCPLCGYYVNPSVYGLTRKRADEIYEEMYSLTCPNCDGKRTLFPGSNQQWLCLDCGIEFDGEDAGLYYVVDEVG